MINYREKIIEILKKSNGLTFSSIEVELLRSLSESEKREYRFDKFFVAIYDLENDGIIFRGKGGEFEKGKFYLKLKNSNS
ncbi:MAG: hypothetical protein QXS48_04125 [Candidatus Aenigmatarchaeota archaeon]